MIQNITEFLTFYDVCASLVRANKQLQSFMENHAVYHNVALTIGNGKYCAREVTRWLTSEPKRCARIRSLHMSMEDDTWLFTFLKHCKKHQGRPPLVINNNKWNPFCNGSGWMYIQSEQMEWSSMKSWVVREEAKPSLPYETFVSQLTELTFYSSHDSVLGLPFLQRCCPASLQTLNFVGYSSDFFSSPILYTLLNLAVNLIALQISRTSLDIHELHLSLPKRLQSLSLAFGAELQITRTVLPPTPEEWPDGHPPVFEKLKTLSMDDVVFMKGLTVSVLTRLWPNISSLYLADVYETKERSCTGGPFFERVENRKKKNCVDLSGWQHLESLTTGFIGLTDFLFSPQIPLRVLRSANQGILDELIRVHHNTLVEVHGIGQRMANWKWLTLLGNTLKNLSVCDTIVTMQGVCSLASMKFASNLNELRIGKLEPLDPSDENDRKVQQEFNQLFEHSFPKLVRLYTPTEYHQRIRRQRPLVSVFSNNS